METQVDENGPRNLCIITGKDKEYANEFPQRHNVLDWASNHINEVAKAARASSTLIQRQHIKTPGGNHTTSEEEMESEEDCKTS